MTFKEKMIAALLPGIPVSFWNSRELPDTEEEVEAFVKSVETSYKAFTHEMGEKVFAGPSKETKASKEEVAAILRYM